MAFTSAEESRLRALMNQDASLLTLATNEPAIIQELGAQDVTIDELQLASSLLQTDKLLGRFGGEDKAVILSVLRAFMNNGMAALSDLTALLPKRIFSENDFIRIPDVPGGLIIQWGRVYTSGGSGRIQLPVNNPSLSIAVLLTDTGVDASSCDIWSAGKLELSGCQVYSANNAGQPTNTNAYFLFLGY